MRRVTAIVGCLLLAAAACTETRPEEAAPVTTTTALSSGEIATGKVAGMQGTVPRAEPRESFEERLAETAPGLPDTSFAAEAYDVVMTSALAAELAATDAPGRLAGQIPEATRLGQKCFDWRQCKDLVDAGADIDYDGVSGAIDMLDSGEPGEASFAVLRFGDDDTLEQVGSRNAIVEAPVIQLPTRDFRGGPGADGTLRIGLLVGTPDGDEVRAEAQRAGARIAVEEINRIDGVLSEPVELVEPDDEAGELTDTIEDLLDEGVDVILGPSSSDQLAEAIPAVTGAGVVLFSAAAAADPLTAATGEGLFFRMAPARSVQAKVLAEVAAGDGALELLVLAQEGTYGTSLANEFTSSFEDLGGTVVATLGFDPASVDPAVINAALASASDGIVIFGDPEPMGAVITSLATAGRGPEQEPYYTADINSVLTRYVN